MLTISELLNEREIPNNKKQIIRMALNELGPFSFKKTIDSDRVIREFGLEKELQEQGFHEKNGLEYKGLIKELIKEFKPELKSIIIFGSLFKGHYFDSEKEFNNLKERVSGTNNEFLYYSLLSDLFNYPYFSDVDLCLVGDLNIDKVKQKLSESKYHFEHASIIRKEDFAELMRYFQTFNNKGYKDKTAKFELIRFKENKKKQINELRNELNELKNKTNNPVKELMINFSINRLDEGINSEDAFGHSQALRALSQSYIINFDPYIARIIETVNDYANLNPEYMNFINNFNHERAVNDVIKNNRINKWHFLKAYRISMLNNFSRKIDEEVQ